MNGPVSVSAPIVLPPLQWLASPNKSSRHGTTPDLLVLHETAGSFAGAVSWLRNPASSASAHLVLNEPGTQCVQLVRLADKAWTQAAYNPRCVSLELANVTTKGYATDHQLRVAARIFGWLLWQLGIPDRWARGGVGPGVCRHLELGAAGGGHTQCGPSDTGWQLFRHYLAHEVERGDYRRTWARL